MVEFRRPGHSPRKLDSLDRKILYELDTDSRQPAAKIAKKARAPVRRVEERIADYEKSGRILNRLAVIDYRGSDAYTFYVCNIKVNNIDSVEEDRILKKIALMPQSTLIFKSLGAWDILIGTMGKDIFEAKGNFNSFFALFGDKIAKRMIVTHMGAYHYGRRYLLEKISQPEKFDAPMLKTTPQPYAITGGRSEAINI
ncbi:MAG: Lrp/AsnC family transcriptional regulator, partial [Candidatus Micrarchaeota archaeon]